MDHGKRTQDKVDLVQTGGIPVSWYEHPPAKRPYLIEAVNVINTVLPIMHFDQKLDENRDLFRELKKRLEIFPSDNIHL